MSYDVIDLEIEVEGRDRTRKVLIETMLEEKPGTGTGDDSSKYRYNVERFEKYAVYLMRPATINYGLDFTVNVDGLWFKTQKKRPYPNHQEIIDILKYCKETYSEKYGQIKDIINEIYQCKRVDLSSEMGVFFKDYEGTEHPIEIILLVIKWLFIEQDCTYWNFSGRGKLYGALEENGLV